MIAVVFAAGIGSRLKPFTDKHPKALAPVADVPALARVLRKLSDAGANKIIVNVHHFAEQVTDFLSSNDFGTEIEISDESELLLDTGGALAKIYRENNAFRSLKPMEKVLVHNSDIITDFPVNDMYDAYRNANATVLVDGNRHSTRHLLFDNCRRLRGWENVSTGAVKPINLDSTGLHEAAFGGVHVLDGRTLKLIDEYCGEQLHPFGIVDFYIDNADKLDIRGYTPTEPYKWFDIGTPEKLKTATEALRAR